ncbi:restriction endonuclease subunit S [Acinetobacter johnsonii]|uniref:Restriction endonuclease subunit S n=2 Tax=Acinetobacter johnsonii TaxID=40214 RepID=A0A3Q8XF60_ACIJO|nr:restriction endonuclease subunit S [Acinetobacter johnsonii]
MASDLEAGLINFSSCKHISPQQAGTLRKGFAKEGDVLLSHKATIGRTAIVQPNDNEYIVLTPQVTYYRVKDETKLNNIYLKSYFDSYFFQTILNQWAGSGSTRAYLGITEQLKLPVIVPPIESQIEIASFAHNFNSKIHLNTQINQTLESIAQAIFKSWFIDFEPVRAKIAAKQEGKDPERAAMCVISGKSEEDLKQMAEDDFAELQATAALFPDELVESELGEVPKGWDKYSLSKMITLIGGGTPKRSEPNYWNGDIFWFSVKDVPNEGEVFVITTQEKISELGLNKSSTKLLPVGTTIITARGTVGKIALVGYEMAMNQSCYGIQGINGVKQFMTYYLIKNAVEVLKKNTHGAVFDTITQATFDTVTSIKPSIEMMDLFESKIEKIMGHIKNNLYENNSLIALRDTLLPKLLSGEIDVSGLQGEVA